jgi:iron(III) transport system permease protein
VEAALGPSIGLVPWPTDKFLAIVWLGAATWERTAVVLVPTENTYDVEAETGVWQKARVWLTPERIVCTIAVVLLLWLVLYPVVILLVASVRSGLPMGSGHFTLANFAVLFADASNFRAIINTVISSMLTTICAVAIGTSLAWITSRTDVPGRRFFENAFVIPYYLSPFIGAIAWTMLANPRIGVLNTIFTGLLGFRHGPFNIYSLTGLVFVMALYYSPIVFLFVAGALRSMDPALEEASRIHGVGALGTTLRITLPVVSPALLSSALLVFLNAAGQFGIPAVIGIPMNYEVITTRIWVGLGYFPAKYTEAAAFSVVLLALSLVAVAMQHHLLAKKSFVTVSGRGFKPSVISLGRMRYIALAVCAFYFLLSIGFPYGALLFTSIQPYLNFGFHPASWTLAQYADVLFHNSQTIRATQNSLLLATLGATATMLLSLAISYVVVRTHVRGRQILSYLATLPAAIPAVVFAVAILWAYIFLPIRIYGTIWLLLIAYIAHYIPFGVRATSSGLAQLSVELEESSRIHGASWLKTLFRIVVPLLKPAMAVGWILIFVEIIRSLSLSILLYSDNSVVMPVVIYDLYETGAYPALSAFSVLQTLLVFAAIYAAKKITRVDSLMQLK